MLLSFFTINISAQDWVQIGLDIDGEAAGDRSGDAVGVSADGNLVVIGAERNDGSGLDAGHARVYQNIAGTWTQLGADINGEAAGDLFGCSVSMSDDGTTIAIGGEHNDAAGADAGHVRVYELIGGVWTQVGADIDGEAAGDRFGCSVSLNSDGTFVVVGADRNDGGGVDAGHARVYQYTGGAWTQVGGDIDGELAYDWSGNSVSINDAGTIVAVGATRNDGAGASSGHARVFQNIAGVWTQLGADIDGEAAGDECGKSIALDGAGNRVVVGAPKNDGTGADAGHIRIYEIVGGVWTQVGADLDGLVAGDEMGWSVSINSAGDRVAFGAPKSDDGSAEAGQVRVFENAGAAWTQVGTSIAGEAIYDRSGWQVALNGVGNILANGAYVNDGNGTSAGHVRMYRLHCDSLDTLISTTELCLGEMLTLDGTSVTGGTITWDNGAVNGVPFAVTTTGITTYTATSTNISDCPFSIDINVFELPTVTATATPTEICLGESVTLTGGGADTYVWDSGVTDGVPHTPDTDGTLTFEVIGTSTDGCNDTTTVDVLVNPLPIITATATPAEICLGESVTFTGGGADTYTWTGGVVDGTPYTPLAAGTINYIVTGTATATGCSDTASVDLIVNELPTVTAGVTATEICLGESVTFTGGGADTYTWDGGIIDGTPHTPVAAGTTTHTVTGTVTATGCENTASIDLTVHTIPTVTATATPDEICLGESITFTGAGADTYVWDGGVTDGVPFTPVTTGVLTFNVTGTVGATTCENTASVDVTVNELPVVTGTVSDHEICIGESVTFNGGGADTYIWTGGVVDGVLFTPGSTGTTTYTVTGTETATGCSDTADVELVVHALPVVTATATPSTICLGESVTFTGGGASTYNWDDGVVDGTPFTPTETGSLTFNVIGEDAVTGCRNTASVAIYVHELPIVSAAVDDSVICYGESIVFNGSGAVSYAWDLGVDDDEAYTPDTTGLVTFTVTGTDANGCENTASINVLIHALPTVTARVDTIIDTAGDAVLVAETDIDGTFDWWPNDDLDCSDCDTTIASPIKTTTYTVYFTDENGCEGSDTVLVLVNFVEGLGVPEAFSPNGDGYNDILFVKGYNLEEMHFEVYNKYGERVFETSDQSIGWDGYFRNQPENPGVFTWVLHYNLIDGRTGNMKGNTTLIR